jgi:hypothetical protein
MGHRLWFIEREKSLSLEGNSRPCSYIRGLLFGLHCLYVLEALNGPIREFNLRGQCAASIHWPSCCGYQPIIVRRASKKPVKAIVDATEVVDACMDHLPGMQRWVTNGFVRNVVGTACFNGVIHPKAVELGIGVDVSDERIKA